jgi:hypothetical protein
MGINSETKLNEKLAEIKKPFWKDRDDPIPIALVYRNLVTHQPTMKAKSPYPIWEDYGLNGIPTGVLIDRQGRVVGRFDPRSNRGDAALDAVLKKVL